eukprot:sb/3467246/
MALTAEPLNPLTKHPLLARGFGPMALPAIFKDSVCYESFEKRELPICRGCGLARFPTDDRKSSASLAHQAVCHQPDIAEISNLSLSDALERLTETLENESGFDHNSVFLLYHVDDMLRAEGRVSWKKRSFAAQTIDQTSVALHTSFRNTVMSVKDDSAYFERLWACPGMSQFLLTCDLRSNTYSGLVARFPDGVRGVPTEILAKYNTECDTSGEWLGLLVIQMLLFSCVIPQRGNDEIEKDGEGELRNTPYSTASWTRLVELMTREDSSQQAGGVCEMFGKWNCPLPPFLFRSLLNTLMSLSP